MDRPLGSWSLETGVAKTAAEHDLRFGHGLLRRESADWPPYFAVTTPSAYRVAEKYLARDPEAVERARLLDWTHLQSIADATPDSAEIVVGIGGGIALDASKYVALTKNLPLVIVPTIVSTGSIIHSIFAKWEGHTTVGSGSEWPWLDFDHAVIDYDVVLEAPSQLNTAGLGDVLCGYAPMAEWRRNSRLGIGPPFDEAAVSVAAGHFEQVRTGFPKTLDAGGGLTPDSVRFIVTAIQERDDKTLKHPDAPAADHAVWLAAEEINRKGWIHGEFVALGALMIAWHCQEDPDTLADALDACQVRRRPTEIGVARDELVRALDYAPAFMSDEANGRDVRSILRSDPITGARFDALWDYLETA